MIWEAFVFAHNEEDSLDEMLKIVSAWLKRHPTALCTVISSGSTDRTNDIALAWTNGNSQIR